MLQIFRSFFGQSSYASLQRQLNLYGFSRIGKALYFRCIPTLLQDMCPNEISLAFCLATSYIPGSGPDKHGYYHPNFLRGMPSLVELVHRVRIKGQGPRKPAETPPAFYQMPWMPSFYSPASTAHAYHLHQNSGRVASSMVPGPGPVGSQTMTPTSLARIMVAPPTMMHRGYPDSNDEVAWASSVAPVESMHEALSLFDPRVPEDIDLKW